jgi:hypothetical protein
MLVSCTNGQFAAATGAPSNLFSAISLALQAGGTNPSPPVKAIEGD